MQAKAKTYVGDCLNVLPRIPKASVDLVYVDPPFFTQKVQALSTRDGSNRFSFRDIWDSDNSYADFIYQRVLKARETLCETGSIFFHCDKSASHIVRLMLDSVFGAENFQSEIIWSFKRWSNSKKGLLPSHQTIFFYSKSQSFKFNTQFKEYSPSTNIDQIMQKRSRDHRNKSVYARNKQGEIVSNGTKKGVPLSDVWEIPFLNPKAKERVGYPTQKPTLLLNQIIELVTDEGDIVLDPFCGSGTTLVSAQHLARNSIGIDTSKEAIELTKSRLKNPVITNSALLEKGVDSYRQHDSEASKHLTGIEYTPVHRNKGIDGLLKNEIGGLPTFVRVQRATESVGETVEILRKATSKKGKCRLLVVAIQNDLMGDFSTENVHIIKSTALAVLELAVQEKPYLKQTPRRRKANEMAI
jgi:site-specific DNA-methyltransferase (adenine-specific)